MKRNSTVVLACAGLAFLGSCERHDWEDTRKLHHHGGEAHGDGADAAQEGGGAKTDAAQAEGSAEAKDEQAQVDEPATP